MRTLGFVLQLVFSYGLTLGLQLWDKRRLTPEQRARSWNWASWASAVYNFGPLSMLGWGWVTRKTIWGLLFGALSVALIMAIVALVNYLFGMATGITD